MLDNLLHRIRLRWWAVGLGVLVVAITVLAVMRGSSAKPATTADTGPLVTVIVPGVSTVATTVTFTGTVHARYDMPIGVEGEGGRITAVLVEAGDRVKRGQVLARLSNSVLAPQVHSLAASLDESRASAELAAAESRRAQAVGSAGALSLEEIERRRAAATTAEAKVRVAAAQLAEAQARLSRTEIRAPADGIILTRTAEVGQTVTPGGPELFRLAENGEVELRGAVAEQDLPRLKVGQSASVRLTGAPEPFTGTVRLLGAVIDPQSRLGSIRIALAPHPALRPGAFARAEVTVANGEQPLLPQTAVLADEAGSYVFVVDDQGIVVRRDVQIAGIDANGVAISAGLSGREQVVTTAGGFLRVGEHVKAVPFAKSNS